MLTPSRMEPKNLVPPLTDEGDRSPVRASAQDQGARLISSAPLLVPPGGPLELDIDRGVHGVFDDAPPLLEREPRPRPEASTLSKEEAESAEPVLRALGASDPDDPRFETADDPRIPAEQMYFKIGEVARITGIKPYVLRYWEAEFPWIRPEKTSSKQRRYRRQDIALLFRIARLRYEEQLTIDRTRQAIREDRKQDGAMAKTRARRTQRARSDEVDASIDGEGDLAGQLALGLMQAAKSTQVHRALAEMRKTVLELLEAVEE